MSLGVMHCCFEHRRGDTKPAMSLVHREADHPPSSRIFLQNPTERSVALDPRYLSKRHDAAPPVVAVFGRQHHAPPTVALTKPQTQ